MRTFTIGDIHGNFKALKQCFERSHFDYEKDQLICLGDVCDGFPFVKDCIDELLKIKNLVYIIGNHDDWALEWYDREEPHTQYDAPAKYWTKQGGLETLQSYDHGPMPKSHIKLLKDDSKSHLILDGNLFVHGGIIPSKTLFEHTLQDVMWDRGLISLAWHKHKEDPAYMFGFKDVPCKKIFIGHTTTQWFGQEKSIITREKDNTSPLFMCNVIALDTGGGWDGRVTIMDVGTKQHWQSDLAIDLYPNIRSRKGQK